VGGERVKRAKGLEGKERMVIQIEVQVMKGHEH
jgi:hypothetical protein